MQCKIFFNGSLKLHEIYDEEMKIRANSVKKIFYILLKKFEIIQ